MGACTMDFTVCAQCGKEIEGKSIQFRNKRFCSDECCEEYVEMYLEGGEPAPEELEVEDVDDLDTLDLVEEPDLDDLDDLDLDDDF